MARRGYSRRGVSRGGFGGKMTNGFIRPSGIIGAAILGLGTAALVKRFVGAPLGQYTGAASGFVVGGLGGALGGYLHDNVGNVGGGASSGGYLN